MQEDFSQQSLNTFYKIMQELLDLSLGTFLGSVRPVYLVLGQVGMQSSISSRILPAARSQAYSSALSTRSPQQHRITLPSTQGHASEPCA